MTHTILVEDATRFEHRMAKALLEDFIQNLGRARRLRLACRRDERVPGAGPVGKRITLSDVPIRAPVGPWDHPGSIRQWIELLEATRRKYRDHAPIDHALAQAHGWLQYATKRWAVRDAERSA